jgi:hypothetical protein
VSRTRKANAGEVAPALLLIRVNAAGLVLTGLSLASIELVTERAHVLVLTGAGKSCLKHKNKKIQGILLSPLKHVFG